MIIQQLQADIDRMEKNITSMRAEELRHTDSIRDEVRRLGNGYEYFAPLNAIRLLVDEVLAAREKLASPKNTLWLDDVRDPVEFGYRGALWVRSARVAKQLIMDNPGFFTGMSLDHDLAGSFEGHTPNLGDGTELVNYLEETGSWPPDGVRVHSSNEPATARMLQPIVAHYGRNFQTPRRPVE